MTTSISTMGGGVNPVRNRSIIRLDNIIAYAVLTLFAVIAIVPFYWMLNTSLKTDDAVLKIPPDVIPSPASVDNYPSVFQLMPMANALWNSTKIATLLTFGTLLTSSMAAYSFAKIKFRYKRVIFLGFLATIMIPGQVTLIPLYMLFSRMGWIDTHLPLIVPGVMINAYGVFLIRQFMSNIPDAYIEAARLDGASHFQIYWKIMLPLCKPALITLGLFSFLGSWNNFLGALIFLSTDSNFTVPLIINSFRTVYYVQWGLLMAASCIAIIPPLILYVIGQRYFVEGVTLSGLKG